MKLHSWPHPVLCCKLLCEPHESDYKADCDFTLELTKVDTGRFKMKILVGSGVLCDLLASKRASLVTYREALASPLRMTRKVDATRAGTTREFLGEIDIDTAKFSGGLKVCAYIVANQDLHLETSDCIPGYPAQVKVYEGALLAYSNAKLIEDRKSSLSSLFKVIKSEAVDAMTVSSEGEAIVISLPPNLFLSYRLYRGQGAGSQASSAVACAFLLPALVEVISGMSKDAAGDVWPEGASGAKGVLAAELNILNVSPDLVAQKGAAYAAASIFNKLPFGHSKMFDELRAAFSDENNKS